MSGRSLARILCAACALVLAAGCARVPASGDRGLEPRILVASDTWRATVSPVDFTSRVRSLSDAIERLRQETASGWTGRQDDVTGYLTELTGGRFAADGSTLPPEVTAAFLERHGPALFGIGPDQVEVVSSEPGGAEGGLVLRAEQRVGSVPVLDAQLTIVVGQAETAPSVDSIRGRVFPGVSVGTDPLIPAAKAVSLARRASGGNALPDPRLVVIPVIAAAGGGSLTWEVTVLEAPGVPSGAAFYYVDALGGAVLSVRPAAVEFAIRLPSDAVASVAGSTLASVLAQGEGKSVKVQGTGPIGEELEAVGRQSRDGRVELVDTTTPSFVAGTGKGGLETHDAASELPGPVVTSRGATIDDPEALAAHAYSRYTLDYFHGEHGRLSWDGAGGTTISSVRYEPKACNASFIGTQVVFGTPADCVKTMVDVDIVGHEWTHGVTASSSGLLYLGQSGALNESFSDYFGNIIGDRFRGRDSAAISEGACAGLATATDFCQLTPEGLAVRNMLNGATFADYLYLVSTPFRMYFVGLSQDSGGVHLNSAVWNNALWTIRTQLARIDGMSGVESPLAHEFDAIVYAALTRHLTPSSGFLDARGSIEQASIERGADPTIVRVIRETFDLNKICPGCVPAPADAALPIATKGSNETLPAVSADRIAWVDFAAGDVATGGDPMVSSPEGPSRKVADGALALSVAFAGDALVTAEDPASGRIARYDLGTGSVEVLDSGIGDSVFLGVAGSEDGAAWVDLGERALTFVDASGQVTSTPLPAEVSTSDFVAEGPFGKVAGMASIGTGGRTVAIGGASGVVIAWKVGSPPSVVGRVPGQVLAVAAHGDRVLAVSVSAGSFFGTATLFDLQGGGQTELSDNAAPFGAAVSEDYAVWTQGVGLLTGAVAEIFGAIPDTNLYMHSFGTGSTYQVLARRGQQGFPALSGNRLVWQEAANGGDDVYLGLLPKAL